MSVVAAVLLSLDQGSSSRVAQAAILFATLAFLIGAGFAVGRDSGARLSRFRSVLWFAATGVFFGFLSVLLIVDANGDPKAMVGTSFLVTTAFSAVLWSFHRRSLQQLAMFGGALGSLLAFGSPTSDSFTAAPDFSLMLLATLLSGAVWLALGVRGWLAPRRTALVTGSLALTIAPVFLSFSGDASTAGLVAAIVGAALIPGGHVLRDRAVSGIGIAALGLGLSIVVTSAVDDSEMRSVVALGAGCVLLGSAWMIARRATSAPEPNPSS